MVVSTFDGLQKLDAYKEVLDIHNGNSNLKLIDSAVDTIENIVKDPGPIDGAKRDGVALITAIITLAKETPAIYNELSADTKAKMDAVMRCASYVYAYMLNSTSDVLTGFDFKGNFNKRWGANYCMSYTPVVIFGVYYFGGYENFNQMLLDFDYDREIAIYEGYGWENLVASWTVEAPIKVDGTRAPDMRELTMNGGIPYAVIAGNVQRAGHTEGVKRVLGMKGDGSEAPIRLLIDRCVQSCCNEDAVVSSIDIDNDNEVDARMYDGTVSDFEGQIGMFREFKSGDYSGFRSDLAHCTIDFNQINLIISMAFALNLAPWHPEVWDKILVGCGDYLYKVNHGWIGRCLGNRTSYEPGYFNGMLIRNKALEIWAQNKAKLEAKLHWPEEYR